MSYRSLRTGQPDRRYVPTNHYNRTGRRRELRPNTPGSCAGVASARRLPGHARSTTRVVSSAFITAGSSRSLDETASGYETSSGSATATIASAEVGVAVHAGTLASIREPGFRRARVPVSMRTSTIGLARSNRTEHYRAAIVPLLWVTHWQTTYRPARAACPCHPRLPSKR